MKHKIDFNFFKSCIIYKLKIHWILITFLSIVISFLLCNEVFSKNDFLFCFITVEVLIIFIFVFLVTTLELIGSRYVAGSIYKKHLRNNVFGENGDAYLAKAQSYDKKYTTKWKNISKRYYKYKNIPVKIIVKRNKAIGFIIDDFSFKNKENMYKNHL